MTIGSDRMRLSEPTGHEVADRIKQLTAEIIDLCEQQKDAKAANSEKTRCLMVAQHSYEDASMWALRGLTAGQR